MLDIVDTIRNSNEQQQIEEDDFVDEMSSLGLDQCEQALDTFPNYIARLSNDVAHVVCSFLTRDDIEQFKDCDRESAIISLEHMKKFSIRVWRTRDFYQRVTLEGIWTIRLNEHQHLQALVDKWDQDPERIPCNRQIVMDQSGYVLDKDLFTSRRIENYRDETSYDGGTFYPKLVFLGDTLDFALVTRDGASRLRNYKDLPVGLCRLVTLEFFDVPRQSSQNVQTLIVGPAVTAERLLRYI